MALCPALQEGLDTVDGLDGLGESWRAGQRALFN